jgi:hypothetical protein
MGDPSVAFHRIFFARRLTRAGSTDRPMDEAIDEAAAQIRGLFPGFVPNILRAP